MPHDFIPRRDVDFRNWSAFFSAKINAAPGDFGLTPALAGAYAALDASFAAAYDVATAPNTRTPSAVQTKNDARKAAEREARRLARLIQATPGITNTQRQNLGLTVRDDVLSPVPRPREAPAMHIERVRGSIVRVRLRDRESERRGKPAGVAGAVVLAYVGADPPASRSQWRMAGNATRTLFDVAFGSDVPPGSKVWLAAYWFNPRGQHGPACMPVETYVQQPSLIRPKLALAA